MPNQSGKPKPKPVQSGKYFTASDFNRIAAMVSRRIQGGSGIRVRTFKDTVIIENASSKGRNNTDAAVPVHRHLTEDGGGVAHSHIYPSDDTEAHDSAIINAVNAAFIQNPDDEVETDGSDVDWTDAAADLITTGRITGGLATFTGMSLGQNQEISFGNATSKMYADAVEDLHIKNETLDRDIKIELNNGGSQEVAMLFDGSAFDLVINTTVSGDGVLDEDNMASDSASHLATQQSIKAYADSIAGTGVFTGLSDTPANYTAAAGKIVRVNATPNGLEFVTLTADLIGAGALDIGANALTVNSIEIVGADGEVNKAAVQDSGNWDTAYGWGNHASAGYLTTVAYNDLTGNPSDRITAGAGLTWAGDTLNSSGGGGDLLADGSVPLTADWDIGAGNKIEADEITARSASGLTLSEDGGLGIFIENTTGYVGVNETTLEYQFQATAAAGIAGKFSTPSDGTVLILDYNPAGAGVQFKGPDINFRGKSDTTADQQMGLFGYSWSTVTHATRSSKMALTTIKNGGAGGFIVLDADGDFGIGTSFPSQILDTNQGGGNMISDGYDTHSLESYKENIIDAPAMLDRLKNMPIREWTRKPYVSAEEIKKAAIRKFGKTKWAEYFPTKDAHRGKAIADMPDGEMKIWIDAWCHKKRVTRRKETKWMKKYYGAVAEEAAQHMPEMASENKNGLAGVNLNNQIGIALQCIKELTIKVEALAAA